ncbi:hypothetical protein SYNPS1DRAFT_21922 [Syncephalis pseudoplumigaleata]|uniref:Uncharacterized protein n=2 Tax=Zoopagomycota TaxID=1913638 RepID=A0A4Q0A0P8_9FUNG|nr:hypothetical protein SYNPS1DRAFT_21922 [Syncephalis pseudoplumigaleata]RKP38690.1 hypothetical protein BJ085DRAFT_41381 [Dimargaris cristalligena]|eukprot:RKP26280.1 hypothetical protein SYNPS1DRAFT_21922 [Syncephalis pseudoplumigaleata]
MDTDWCVVCDRHVDVPGSLYCTEVCRWKDSSSYTFNDDPPVSSVRFGRGAVSKPKPEPYRLRPSTLQTLPNLPPLTLPLPLCARSSDASSSSSSSRKTSPFSGLDALGSSSVSSSPASPSLVSSAAKHGPTAVPAWSFQSAY